jgi:hypothetical protein
MLEATVYVCQLRVSCICASYVCPVYVSATCVLGSMARHRLVISYQPGIQVVSGHVRLVAGAVRSYHVLSGHIRWYQLV